MTTLSPRSEFVPLGSRISLYTPEQPITGQTIILCIWLGAALKHIAKYTDVYRGIAPEARILLIESAVLILVSSYARQRAVIVPAVTVVLVTLAECSHVPLSDGNKTIDDRSNRTSSGIVKSKIILHMFSNGGINTATQFLLVLHERLRASLSLSGMLYDSCSVKGTYWKDHRAMVYSLPKDILSRALGNLVVHIILVLLHAEIACGLENPASLLRRTLLDETKVSGGAPEDPFRGNAVTDRANEEQDDRSPPPERAAGKRSCYLYSKSDPMVDWTDVRDHAADARRKGWDVEEIMFDGSGHCGHFQKDEEKYVEAMQRMWMDEGGVAGGMAMSNHGMREGGGIFKL